MNGPAKRGIVSCNVPTARTPGTGDRAMLAPETAEPGLRCNGGVSRRDGRAGRRMAHPGRWPRRPPAPPLGAGSGDRGHIAGRRGGVALPPVRCGRRQRRGRVPADIRPTGTSRRRLGPRRQGSLRDSAGSDAAGSRVLALRSPGCLPPLTPHMKAPGSAPGQLTSAGRPEQGRGAEPRRLWWGGTPLGGRRAGEMMVRCRVDGTANRSAARNGSLSARRRCRRYPGWLKLLGRAAATRSS